ncbi:MAG TPA: hypothetical protein VGQ20_13210, partial [Acidimicrobiales bacterium]|nr:hypothetical protein [Acidimicrobiales bacterium]
EPVFDDPDAFWSLVATNGPFPSLQRRVMQSAVESAAITGEWVTPDMEAESRAGGAKTISVTASFRSYWMQAGRPLRDDAAWLARHEPFVASAKRLLDATVVRPDEIYVNAQVPQSVHPGSCHVDIPKFRGMGRRDFPVWLLTTMRRSGLFDHWHIPVATAVCWFYDGPGGTYAYWPDGPDAPPRQTAHPFTNTAVVGENDTMFHRGDAAGSPGAEAPAGLTLDSELARIDGSTWAVCDHGRELARYGAAEVRFALSWSAEVYADDTAVRIADEHLDNLDIDTVLDAFFADLDARGTPVDRTDDPLHDVGFIAALARAYRVVPSQFPTDAETDAVRRREALIRS